MGHEDCLLTQGSCPNTCSVAGAFQPCTKRGRTRRLDVRQYIRANGKKSTRRALISTIPVRTYLQDFMDSQVLPY